MKHFRQRLTVILALLLSISAFVPVMAQSTPKELVELGRQAYQKKQYTKAYNYYKKAYDMGDGMAAMEIGYLHYFGQGRKKDDAAAYKFFTEAAEYGVPKANIMRGNLYYYGGAGLKKNLKKAAECYRQSAELGEVGGQSWLGQMYMKGEGVPKDLEMAAYWYGKAAEQGDAYAKQVLRDLGKSTTVTHTTTTTTTTTNPTQTTVSKPKASVTWLTNATTTSQRSYTLKAGIKSSSKIENVVVKVNGQTDRGIKTVISDDYDMTINRELALAEGQNTIRIEVTNAGGTAVSERTVTCTVETAANTNTKSNTTSTKSKIKEKRVALVVGNSDYHDSNMKLANPSNDATDLADRLSKLGFTVVRSLNLTKQSMDNAIQTFSSHAKGADVALFFYAGHGIQYQGDNYLVPVDAQLPSEEYVKYNCTNANIVLDVMERLGCSMKIVILDACRNNPFARSWHRSIAGGGLGIMSAPKGTFIAFATSPGDVALDGTNGERNSPYTTALLQTLDKQGLSITDFFQEVLERVATATNERQTPWTSNSFRGKFVFNP